MFDKKRIIETMQSFSLEFGIEPTDIQILAGAAMVLRDLRLVTSDIDIWISREDCLRIEKTRQFKRRVDKDDPDVIWLVRGNLDIRDTSHRCNMAYDWFLVQSLESLLEMKLKLNREKDQDDIKLIRQKLNE
jgi:hypothetical protein